MKVTKLIRCNLTPKDSGVCGEYSIILDDELCIHQVRVINGKKGLFIAFPNGGTVNEQDGKRRYADIVHPVNEKLRQYIKEVVLKDYNSAVVDLSESTE